jgi:hypothetical protein
MIAVEEFGLACQMGDVVLLSMYSTYTVTILSTRCY